MLYQNMVKISIRCTNNKIIEDPKGAVRSLENYEIVNSVCGFESDILC